MLLGQRHAGTDTQDGTRDSAFHFLMQPANICCTQSMYQALSRWWARENCLHLRRRKGKHRGTEGGGKRLTLPMLMLLADRLPKQTWAGSKGEIFGLKYKQAFQVQRTAKAKAQK